VPVFVAKGSEKNSRFSIDMMQDKPIRRALISVYNKEPSRRLIETLHQLGVSLVSTGGTLGFIQSMGIDAMDVEQVTGFPEVLGGRVKTLHPAIFGGILARSHIAQDMLQLQSFNIQLFDLVVVDLYPFEASVSQNLPHDEIIEKIDIGGISLLRAAAKNYADVLVVPSMDFYNEAIKELVAKNGNTSLEFRQAYATAAFRISSDYDNAIFKYLERNCNRKFERDSEQFTILRYGENPHQQAFFKGNLSESFEQIHGKELSYNNLVDIDAALQLISEFSEPAFAILKHTNACGVGMDTDIAVAMQKALDGDPLSAFGGVLISNRPVSSHMAMALNALFFEVLMAPGFDSDSLDLLKTKKNRILLVDKMKKPVGIMTRSLLDGILKQTTDNFDNNPNNWQFVTFANSNEQQISDLYFANRIVKHLKSNAVALVKDGMLIGTGSGQTSRIDAVHIALEKAKRLGHNLQDAVLASDAFFPFSDWVEIVHNAGIKAVVQPGGSLRDKDSIEQCNKYALAMAFTGIRHFKH